MMCDIRVGGKGRGGVDKEKTLDWLSMVSPKETSAVNQEFISAAKIIKDFDETKLLGKKRLSWNLWNDVRHPDGWERKRWLYQKKTSPALKMVTLCWVRSPVPFPVLLGGPLATR